MLVRSFIRRLRNSISLERRARIIAKTLPPRRWYRAAVVLTHLQWAICRLLFWRPDILLRNSIVLDRLLLELMQFGTFPISWRAVGAEHLPCGGSNDTGVIYCTSHLPLFALQARVLYELDATPSLVIALAGAIDAEGTYPMPGVKDRVPALPPGGRTIARVMRQLQNGKVVGSLMDEYPGGPLKPQLLRMAGKVDAKVVYLFSELDDQNCIRLTAALPPFPGCKTEEEVQANLAAYEKERQRILAPFHGSRRSAQPRPAPAPRAPRATAATVTVPRLQPSHPASS